MSRTWKEDTNSKNCELTMLPRFPKGPMTPDELNSFSESLIDVYSEVRFTTPFTHHQGISKVKIVFPKDEKTADTGSKKKVPVPAELSSLTTADMRVPAEFASPPVSITSEMPSGSETPVSGSPHDSTIQKCFLHPRIKPSCKRCQEYLGSFGEKPKKRLKSD